MVLFVKYTLFLREKNGKPGKYLILNQQGDTIGMIHVSETIRGSESFVVNFLFTFIISQASKKDESQERLFLLLDSYF